MFPTIEDGTQMRLKRFNINPYCIGGRYVGMMTRISDQADQRRRRRRILPSVVGRHKRKLLLEEDDSPDVSGRCTGASGRTGWPAR